MIRKWLISLRKKPTHVRERVAMTAAGSFTAVVFVLWIVTAPGQFEKDVSKEGEKPQAFSMFFSQIKEQMAGVKESLPEIETASSSPSTPPKTVVLSASSTSWALSSTTVENKKIEREVPIIVVPQSTSSVPVSQAPSTL